VDCDFVKCLHDVLTVMCVVCGCVTVYMMFSLW